MKRAILLFAPALLLAGCDYTGDWLFPTLIEEVPGVQDLGTLEPDVVTTLDEVRAAVRYGEVGATENGEVGGVTFEFEGTGSSVCVWVDPETVYWSQSVAATGPRPWFSYPDNAQDDGDIDLYAGVSVYYSGSPGVEIGNFEVRYQDALGNEIPVEFNECVINSTQYRDGGAHSGRAMPEFCTLAATQQGVSYTVVLESFSQPYDDSRLGYGLLFIDGSCDQLNNIVADSSLGNAECLILGESIDPNSHSNDYRETQVLAQGYSNVEGYAWEESTNFEGLYCAAMSTTDPGLLNYCENEADDIPNRADCEESDVRCFCGDVRDTPTGGSD